MSSDNVPQQLSLEGILLGVSHTNRIQKCCSSGSFLVHFGSVPGSHKYFLIFNILSDIHNLISSILAKCLRGTAPFGLDTLGSRPKFSKRGRREAQAHESYLTANQGAHATSPPCIE